MIYREVRFSFLPSAKNGYTIQHQEFQMGEEEFEVFGAALELFAKNRIDRALVSIIIQARFKLDGLQAAGYIDAAEATAADPGNMVVISIERRPS